MSSILANNRNVVLYLQFEFVFWATLYGALRTPLNHQKNKYSDFGVSNDQSYV